MNKVECYYDEEYDEWQRLEEQKPILSATKKPGL